LDRKRYEVFIERFAEKQIRRVPPHIRVAFFAWVESVRIEGLEQVRKRSGYHDEPLHGKRSGQRSARLSRAYRVIYRVQEGFEISIVAVMEVNKHDY
jgi:proteic killer suppression protein